MRLEERLLALLGDDIHQYAVITTDEIPFDEEVRAICKSNGCGKYGSCWTCPPGCGEVEKLSREIRAFSHAFVFTSKHEIEDSFDIEGMGEAHIAHDKLNERVADCINGMNARLLGAGGCHLCSKCTYPNAPCRFPERAVPSMEACGINVMLLSKAAGINYINGANTVTYFSAVLFDAKDGTDA